MYNRTPLDISETGMSNHFDKVVLFKNATYFNTVLCFSDNMAKRIYVY